MQAEEKVPVAAITSLSPEGGGIAVAASASYGPGIGRLGFVLIDLTTAVPVEQGDVDYAVPLPSEVCASWASTAALAPGEVYRAFFHVYDRTGVNLVAYDRRDFTYDELRERGV